MDKFDDSHNPVPVILSILSGIAKSDELLQIINQSGISIDLSLNQQEDFSNSTRIRAYIPRIGEVLKKSDPISALHAITTTSGTIIQHYPEKEVEIAERLKNIGWDFSEGKILPSTNDVKELYFTEGLEHSAYVFIRELIASAKENVVIIDQWIDKSIFELLKSLDNGNSYSVAILTKENRRDDLEHEKTLFVKEYSKINIQIYHVKDFHDRFLIIDYNCLYHLGASIKDTGKKISMINKLETQEIINSVISRVKNIIGEI